MPGLDRQDSYRTALNVALTELNQLAEMIEELNVRKGRLQVATAGLKPLLAPMEQRIEAGQMPSSAPAEPDFRDTRIPTGPEVMSGELHPVIRFQQTVPDSSDPVQQRIQNALTYQVSA